VLRWEKDAFRKQLSDFGLEAILQSKQFLKIQELWFNEIYVHTSVASKVCGQIHVVAYAGPIGILLLATGTTCTTVAVPYP
jgi:hypothetical protein